MSYYSDNVLQQFYFPKKPIQSAFQLTKDPQPQVTW